MDTASQVMVSIVSGVFVASVASAVTAHFAFRRFYSERWWERKAAAYTDVLEMLYSLLDYPSTLAELEMGDRARALTAEETQALEERYRFAEDALHKAITLGSFTLSEQAIQLLKGFREERYEAQREQNPLWVWVNESDAVYRVIQQMREEARRDLKVDREWFGDS